MYYASEFKITDDHSVTFHFNSFFTKSMKPSSFLELFRIYPVFHFIRAVARVSLFLCTTDTVLVVED